MSTFNQLLDLQLQEQVCYVHCGFCTTVLLVIVPCRCSSMVVTVKCGHCTNLLSVNMQIMRSTFLPLHFFSSVDNQQEPIVEAGGGDEEVPKLTLSKHTSSLLISSSSSVEDNDDDDDDDIKAVNHVVNKPPEKRQRAPSVYNKFIKEEIRRLKTQHPNMSHKQAFSAAAKNWAHSPPIDQEDEEDKSKGLGGEPK
ncbi:hypothetical protein L1987_72435 [Smallanthus sonchifolius]|uniref:Uncharacterized protein n=1 Tax=Smallanthus sonchifolius TaxID=185202 RepID=A0ACB9AUA4_9ASTR|nr:hypothetical protein L1987_72435 [Smallanthus sonchifolius]